MTQVASLSDRAKIEIKFSKMREQRIERDKAGKGTGKMRGGRKEINSHPQSVVVAQLGCKLEST